MTFILRGQHGVYKGYTTRAFQYSVEYSDYHTPHPLTSLSITIFLPLNTMFALPVFTVIAALAGYAAAESHQVTVRLIRTHTYI